MLARQRWVYEARNYLEGRAKIEFVIGQVPIQRDDLNIHEPVVATKEERRLEQKLEDEANKHHDIKRIPVVESPLFETDKVLWILSDAVSWRARFVMKANDDQQVSVKIALATLQRRSPIHAPTYFGKVWTNNTMQAADGKQSWFFSKHCYGISGDLAREISVTHNQHTVGFPVYGTSSDDVNVAKWVTYEDDIRKKLHMDPVKQLWLPDLCASMEQVIGPCDTQRPTIAPELLRSDDYQNFRSSE